MFVVVVVSTNLRDFCSAMPESRPTINGNGIYAPAHKSGHILLIN
jgi:hypothetical protein